MWYRKVKVDDSKQRKKPAAKNMPKGTVTGHYMFISKTLDEMDKFPEMANFYVVMDNAPIHTSHKITKTIQARGYRQYIFLYTLQNSIQLKAFGQSSKMQLNEV